MQMTTTEVDTTVFEELKQMSGSDFIDELVDTFLEDAPKLIGEMKSSLESGDAVSFRRAAHSLKSNGATFGASHLSDLARDMEMLGKENKLDEAARQMPSLEGVLQAVAAELKGLRK
jgi:HPt (histidine-containing phosphotransfer) domain-containing protein